MWRTCAALARPSGSSRSRRSPRLTQPRRWAPRTWRRLVRPRGGRAGYRRASPPGSEQLPRTSRPDGRGRRRLSPYGCSTRSRSVGTSPWRPVGSDGRPACSRASPRESSTDSCGWPRLALLAPGAMRAPSSDTRERDCAGPGVRGPRSRGAWPVHRGKAPRTPRTGLRRDGDARRGDARRGAGRTGSDGDRPGLLQRDRRLP